MITHFQFQKTKGKDYFRQAWNISFVASGQLWKGIYHQDGTIEWSQQPDDSVLEEIQKEVHRLMGFHIFK